MPPPVRLLLQPLARLGLLGRFGLIGLVCFVALGVGLQQLIGRDIAARAVDHDREAVEFLSGLLADRGRPLDSAEAAVTIDEFLEYDHHGPEYMAVRVWDGELRLIRGPAAPRRDVSDARLRRSARAGRPAGHRHGPTRAHGASLHYAVPIRRADRTVGVLEVTQRADGVDAAVRHTSEKLTFLMAGGLGALYLVLLALLRGTSRRLRANGAELARVAVTDEVTQLPNRQGLERHLRLRTREPVAVVMLRVDDLHAAYALHGMERGDDLARSIAGQLRLIAPAALVARTATDEFTLALSAADETAAAIAQAAVDALSDDAGNGRPAHAGLVCRDEVRRAPEQLLMHASAALAAALRGDVPVQRYWPGQEHELRSMADLREEIVSVLGDPHAIDIVVQPIISLASGETLFYEALARFAREPRRSPDAWFAQARRVGLGVELETSAAMAALALGDRPVGTRLSINASPSTLTSAKFLEALPADLDGVTIEITEHQLAVQDTLEAPLAELRRRGAHIAVDDTGAGYAGLHQIMRIAPDVIKLDRQLVAGIDASLTKVALVEAFVRFARRSGALLCAEGVETMSELTTLADLDVAAGQGYAIARPGAAWPETSPEAHRACRAALDASLALVPSPPAGDHDAGHLETAAATLAGARGLDDVARIVRPLAAALHADQVVISLYQPATDELVTLSDHAWHHTAQRYGLKDFPATRAVLRDGHALQVLLSDRTADPRELAVLGQGGHRSALIVPIAFRGASVGIVEAYATEERSWTRSEILRARTVCHQLGAVIAALSPGEPAGGAADGAPAGPSTMTGDAAPSVMAVRPAAVASSAPVEASGGTEAGASDRVAVMQTSVEREESLDERVRTDVIGDRTLRWAAVAALAWLAVYALATLLAERDGLSRMLVGDVLYLVPVIAAAGTSIVAARRTIGRQRTLWRVLAASNVLWLLGETSWAFLELVLHEEPFPSVADVFYLTGAALVPVAIVLGFAGSGQGLRVARAALDASIMVCVTAYVGYRSLVAPQLADGLSLAAVVGSSYALLSVITLMVLCSLAFAGHRRLRHSVALVAIAVFVAAVSNAAYTYLTVVGDYSSGSWITLGWQVEGLLLAIAALVAIRHDEWAPRVRFFSRDFGLPLVLLGVVACFMVVLVHTRHGHLHVGAGLLLGYAVVATVARLWITSSERERIARRLEAALARQERLAVTDALTGLHNRRFFEGVLELEVERSQRTDTPLGLLVVDLDHFKHINDRHGHLAGDEVLRQVAARLSGAVRPSDVVARYGGEEFVLICPDAEHEVLAELAERCRRAVGERPFTIAGGVALRVTASIGAAGLPGHADTLGDLIRVADSALYAAKERGRNVVQLGPYATKDAAGAPSIDGAGLLGFLEGLADEIDARQHRPGQSQVMAGWAARIADELALDGTVRWRAAAGTRFREIGKIRIPDAILGKAGPLTGPEERLLREHPAEGARILAHSPEFAELAPAVAQHRERWDGGGHPEGRSGTDIAVEARIVAVCDVWSDLRCGGAGRPPRTASRARAELRARAGAELDPDVVAAFLALEADGRLASPELDAAVSG